MQGAQLSPRQQRFVDHVVLGSSAAEAARQAGYSAASARVNGPRLLTNAAVRGAIEARRRDLGKRLEVDRQRVLEGLLDAVEMARIQQDPGAMIRAWSEIGRMCGFYVPERAVKIHANIMAQRLIGQLEVLPDADLLRICEDQVG